jgi:hypothetical protein
MPSQRRQARVGRGMDGLQRRGAAGDQGGIDPVVLGALQAEPGEGAHLARLKHDDDEAVPAQARHHGRLITAAGLDPDPADPVPGEPRGQPGMAVGRVVDLYLIALPRDRRVELVFAGVDAGADCGMNAHLPRPFLVMRTLQLLQPAPLGPRQPRIVGGPGGAQRRQAGHAIGQVGDGQGVGLGVIVGVDRIEVAEYQEPRSRRPGRQQQPGLPRAGQPRAIGPHHAATVPGRQRRPVLPAARPGVARGHLDLDHPGLARPPAGPVQVVGGGAEGIGHRAHQIAPAVTIEIDGQPPIGGGDELGLTEGAGPRAVQVFQRQVAAVDELQGGDQFASPEIGAPAAGTGHRRQRVRQVVAAGFPAVIGLDAPDGDNDVAVDAEPPLRLEPRPTKGILVAITVMNWTLASSGRLAMWATARPTCSTSMRGSTGSSRRPAARRAVIRSVIGRSRRCRCRSGRRRCRRAGRRALVDLVSPVIACLVAV